MNIKYSKSEIEVMLFSVIKETEEMFFQRKGKNIYVVNAENNIRVTVGLTVYPTCH